MPREVFFLGLGLDGAFGVSAEDLCDFFADMTDPFRSVDDQIQDLYLGVGLLNHIWRGLQLGSLWWRRRLSSELGACGCREDAPEAGAAVAHV